MSEGSIPTSSFVSRRAASRKERSSCDSIIVRTDFLNQV